MKTDNEVPIDTTPSPTLAELRQRWASQWRVWRSRDGSGMPASWCATYRARRCELGQTLVESTAEGLEAALRRARTGPRPELEPVIGGVHL